MVNTRPSSATSGRCWLHAPTGVRPVDCVNCADAEIERLRTLLTGVVVAAGRMRDDWAESDEAVRKSLWTALHTAADAAEQDVYPL